MWITRVSIRNPVFATMFMVGIAVLGLFAYNRLRVEQIPDVNLPYVLVLTAYPGASPEVVENDVTKPLEYAINTVSGVSLIRSNSREGRSEVFAEFRMSTDMMRAMQDVRDKIAQVRPGFPRDVKDPLLIRIKPTALNALGLGVDQVMNAVRAANQDVPAGRLTSGPSDVIVRVEGKIKDPAQFGRIIVAQQGGGPVYLSQVADVIDGEKEQDSIARINGRPSITLDLQKAQDANIVETGRGINAALEALKTRLGKDVEIKVINSAADQVEKSVNRVKQTIVEGALLTVLIVFLFLHSWRSTIITGLTLPIAVIATFIALHAFGFTLNFLTLMALSLTIGLLIDDAIVVRENIVRHLGMGKTHLAAAREGTEEIGLAVMATTFAIVAVFVPIAFMKGIVGQFFFQFGLTVAVAVLVSLFVSFTLDPMLSSVWRDPAGGRFSRVQWLGRFMDRVEAVVEWVHVVYGRLLEWAISDARRRLHVPVIGVWTAVRTRRWSALKPRR